MGFLQYSLVTHANNRQHVFSQEANIECTLQISYLYR